MRNFRVYKRPSGSYTIQHREHWFAKWELCPINKIHHLYGEDKEQLQQVFPFFQAYDTEHVWKTKSELTWLHTIADELEHNKYIEGAVLVFDDIHRSVYYRTKQDLAVWEHDGIKQNIIYLR